MEFHITTLTKTFLSFISLIFITFSYFVFIHSKKENKSIIYTKTISNITKLPNIHYSTSFYEPRTREYKDFSHKIFPSQIKINYMDFTYEN